LTVNGLKARISSAVLPTAIFRLIGFDEGGVKQTQKATRLVCLIEGGGKLAIWGGLFDHPNIDAVLAAGIPCSVECEYREPEEWGWLDYSHTHWVAESYRLRVVSR
jgi:hypothetical protein